MSEDTGVSKDIDPLLYVFARPLGSNELYNIVVLKHADTVPIPTSEIGNVIAELQEKGLECVYYLADKILDDLAELVRKTYAVEKVVEAPTKICTF